MQSKQIRATRQRYAIKRSIEELKRPLAPKEILDHASRYVPNLGIATVYRNIKFLVASGVLEPIEVPGQSPRYQAAGRIDEPRFVCTRCDRVFNLGEQKRGGRYKCPDGIQVERREIYLYGVRTECLNGGGCPYGENGATVAGN
jgi:Fur family ferric uptake transcriptional regulator